MMRLRSIHRLALLGLLLGSIAVPASAGTSTDQAIAVTVDDFSYLDTSGEPADQAVAHQARLQAFMAALRRDIAGDPRFHLVDAPCADTCTDRPVKERLEAARGVGADILITGGVQKLSTLIQWARAAAIDIRSKRVVFQKLFTFRGDNDEAWQRAESFVSQDVRAGVADQPPVSAAVAAAPVALAVFDLELVDSSAAADSTGQTASDVTGLTDATDAVRQLLAQSGRYRLVDVTAADAEAAKAHALHGCSGCDAQIARQLGADQSFVGIVGRVSRTEYTLAFQIRDSRTGAVVASADSGLRMGANYSWSRGAVSLVRDRLLEGARQ